MEWSASAAHVRGYLRTPTILRLCGNLSKGNIAKKHGVAEPGASVVIIGVTFGLEKLGLMPSQIALREVLPEGRTARSI
jgi:hypothetical protein